jgi:peptide-methionine (S)-S-oxide reductase
MAREIATLAGGCFWCLEAVFDELKGVESVESGYMGGATPKPTYEEVCGGASGHAEVVQVAFDPAVLAFGNQLGVHPLEDLLAVFFSIHDPTTLNRQGNDMGTQYRSAIFTHSPEQRRIAEKVIANLTQDKVFSRPIVTEITPAAEFHLAEGYHQEYYRRTGGSNPYCTYVIDPKVAKFRKTYFDRLKK